MGGRGGRERGRGVSECGWMDGWMEIARGLLGRGGGGFEGGYIDERRS